MNLDMQWQQQSEFHVCILFVFSLIIEEFYFVSLRKEFYNVGVFIFLVFPGAFVAFVDEFEDLSPFNKMKIYCAGVWHNVIIVLIALLLSTTLTFWMSPFYVYNDGAMVLAVDSVSSFVFFLKFCFVFNFFYHRILRFIHMFFLVIYLLVLIIVKLIIRMIGFNVFYN